MNWILTKKTALESTTDSRKTFYNKTKDCWDITPTFFMSKNEPKYIIVDAVYDKQLGCLLIA